MDGQAFAAQRREQLTVADTALRPAVREALGRLVDGEADWADDLVDQAARVWYENFQAEAPGASRKAAEARFRATLLDTLDHTTDYGDVTDAQVERVTRWLSTYATNAGTTAGTAASGRKFKRWVTMLDDAVRDSHEPLHGQVRPIGGTFDVAGTKLAYPGEPKGPPEIWLNCRCVLQPAAREGEAMSAQTYTLGPDDEVDENPDVVEGYDVVLAAATEDVVDEADMVEDVPEDGEELITEIPVHGVSIVEGRATGDGRGFRNNALTFDDVPQPLGYEFEHGHGADNSRVAIVGRIDEIFRKPIDDQTSEVRWRGAIILSKDYAAQAVESIIDGSYNGSSVIIDDVTIDVEEMKQAMRERLAAEDTGDGPDLVDEFIGDGTQPVTWISSARQRRLDMVPTGAFIESRIGLGHAFDDELTDEDRAALAACGCGDLGEFRDVSTEERRRLAGEGAAMPDGSYPIANCDDLRNAIQAIGRAKDPEATKAHIRKRKSALGCDDVELPEDWAIIDDALAHYDAYLSETFAPGTKDGPGWITHPVATARIRRYWVRGKGAAKIRWGAPGDFNRCRHQLAKYVQNPDWLAGLCANMHKEALGYWPATHGKAVRGAASAEFKLVASGGMVYDAALFAEPEGDHAYGVRIDRESRRIYGYLAQWGTCHVGVVGVCRDTPRSSNGYRFFLKGRVQTTAGEQRVGTLTYGIGHADPRMRAAAATAHYDQTEAVRGYVNMGENTHGIWFSGVLAPWVGDTEIDEILAIGAFSGDWRDWGQGELDLIAAVAVNTPGFQLAASGGVTTAVLAAGTLQPEPVTAAATVGLSVDDVVGIIRATVAESKHLDKREQALAPVRANIRSRALAKARAQIERTR